MNTIANVVCVFTHNYRFGNELANIMNQFESNRTVHLIGLASIHGITGTYKWRCLLIDRVPLPVPSHPTHPTPTPNVETCELQLRFTVQASPTSSHMFLYPSFYRLKLFCFCSYFRFLNLYFTLPVAFVRRGSGLDCGSWDSSSIPDVLSPCVGSEGKETSSEVPVLVSG